MKQIIFVNHLGFITKSPIRAGACTGDSSLNSATASLPYYNVPTVMPGFIASAHVVFSSQPYSASILNYYTNFRFNRQQLKQSSTFHVQSSLLYLKPYNQKINLSAASLNIPVRRKADFQAWDMGSPPLIPPVPRL